MKVILADHSPIVLENLKESIAKHSELKVIDTHLNATEAVNAIKKQKPDLAILDIKMPGLNIKEMIDEMNEGEQDVKFIILRMNSAVSSKSKLVQSESEDIETEAKDMDPLIRAIEGMIFAEKAKDQAEKTKQSHKQIGRVNKFSKKAITH